MNIDVLIPLRDRRGNPVGHNLGEALVSLIDQTAVASVKGAGNPRLLQRVSDRIDGAVQSRKADSSGQNVVRLNEEEEKALRMIVEGAVTLQHFYFRRIHALLWPAEVEDDEREVLLGDAPVGSNGQAPRVEGISEA